MSSKERALPLPIHFFQIIGENTLLNGDLMIPRSFVSKHWEGISNPILLVLPNDAKWEMKWEKRGVDDLWLVNGWRKFAEFYSLCKDQFLMFKYEEALGKSRFEVRICHRSALEIDYPSSNRDSNGGGEDSDNSIEILDGTSSSHRRKRSKSPLPHFHSSKKKKKVNPTEDPHHHPSQHVETESAQPSGTNNEKKKSYGDSDNATRPKNKGGRGMFSEEAIEDTESSSAMQRAKAFTSHNPFFIRKMRQTHIHKPFLTIPDIYITQEEEEEEEERKSITFWVSDERSWSGRYSRNSCNGQIGVTMAWKSFVQDNHLKLGDVCVFERSECRGNSFRVVIFRDTEESTPPPPQDGSANPRKQSVRDNLAQCPKTHLYNDSKSHRYDCKMTDDHFTLTLKPCQMKSATHLPRSFVRKYVDSDHQHVTLRVGERSWKVRLDYYPKHGNARFSEGWPLFVKECDLKAGDDCSFQVIDNRENLVIQVRVSRRIH